MSELKFECTDHDKGFIEGCKARAGLIASVVETCEALGIDPEEFTDKAIFPIGVAASSGEHGDDPVDFLHFMTDGNVNIFQKEVIQTEDDHCIGRFHYCPLCEAWKEAGYSAERISYLCNIANKSDFGRASNFKNVELRFPKRLGAGDDYCELDIRRKG